MAFFGIRSIFLGPHQGEVLDDTRLIEDSCYIATNKLVERMLMTGIVPHVDDEQFDEMEVTDVPQIPDDAPLREPDSDFTDLAGVAGKLQIRLESNGTGESGDAGSRVEGSESGSGSVTDPDSAA